MRTYGLIRGELFTNTLCHSWNATLIRLAGRNRIRNIKKDMCSNGLNESVTQNEGSVEQRLNKKTNKRFLAVPFDRGRCFFTDMKTRGLCVLQAELNMSLKIQHQTHFKVKHSGTAIRSCIYYRLTLCKYLMRKDIAKQEQKNQFTSV